MPVVSVIMPVYNAQEYLPEAIESVLKQTFVNFELILVDDGSTDNSGKICDDYSKKDERIIVKHKKNGGISSARNLGLQIAKGNYIAFIDNDDEYFLDLLEDNVKLMEKHEADVVQFGCEIYDYHKSGRIYKQKYNINDENKEITILEKELSKSIFFTLKDKNALSGVWTGIFKKDIIRHYKLKFDESIKHGLEDIMFNLCFFQNANKYILNPQKYYVHKIRTSYSASKKFGFHKIESMLKVLELERRIIFDEEKIDNKEIRWFEIEAVCLINIINMLNHKDCPYNIRQKQQYLIKLKKTTILNDKNRSSFSSKRKDLSIKRKIILLLYYSNKYLALIILVSGYNLLQQIIQKNRYTNI